jgi:hypothetical protein
VLDSTNTRNSTANRSNPDSTHSIGDTLCDAVTKWSAPRTSDTNGAGAHGDGGLDLRTQAAQWPGPAARDHKGINSLEHVTENSTGSMHLDQLPNFVEYCFLPPSSPVPTMPQDGEPSSIASPNTSPPSPKRKLNPIFVEALMRWPTGLSGFERREMVLILWSQRMRSFVSALVSQKDEPKQGSLF